MDILRFFGVERAAFICGCGHTGTTLVATILSAHPDLRVPFYESNAFLKKGIISRLRLARLGLGALLAGKRILVEKTPSHVRHLEEIRKAVSGARFIVMVRDGRDVAVSLAVRTQGNWQAAIDRWMSDTAIVALERHKADVLVVRYEDLIESTESELKRICSFLGIPYTDNLLRYHERPRMWFGQKIIRDSSGVGRAHDAHRNWQVNQPIFDGRARWKAAMPDHLVAEFRDGAPSDLMRLFGYLA